MGTSLSNFQVHHGSVEAVEKVARTVVREAAYLSNPRSGWISLYDAATDRPDPAELHRVAGLLSAGLGCPVWGFLVHDSGVLMYVVYDQGSLRDEYSSKPDYFGPVAEGRRARLVGQAEVVKQYTRPEVTLEEVKRFLAGTFTLGADDQPFKDRVRQTIRSTTPDSIGQMLGMAAQHLGKLPPEILKETLGRAGMPMNHPVMAMMMANPAAFLQQLASNPEALQMMVQQVGAMSEAALEGGLSTDQLPAEIRLLELGKMLGLEAERICTSYALLQRGQTPDPSQFRLLNS